MRRRIPVAAAAIVLAIFAAACSSKPKASTSPTQPATGTSVTASSTPGSTDSPSASAGAGASAGSGASSSEPASQAGSSAATTKSAAPTKGAVDPNAPEVVEPGDIPDNQAFVAFHSPDGFTVDVPEGWARTQDGAAVTFTDKYNSIKIESVAAAAAPTPDSVKAENLGDVSVDPTYKLVDVKAVQRKAGSGVVALYEIGSPPNKVTGKKALLAVERYVFFHNGKDVVLTLSGAKGADNVDPWKTVSDSLKWL
jgi:hypothetical protein